MHAMVLKTVRDPLEWCELADRTPGADQIRVEVAGCGVCRTDLHVIDGELPDPVMPVIPGHEIVGRINALGVNGDTLKIGQRVTRHDGLEFLSLAPQIGMVTRTTRHPLQHANQALSDLRAGRFERAAVLLP